MREGRGRALQNPEEESAWAGDRALDRPLWCLCWIDYPVDRCTVHVLLQKTNTFKPVFYCFSFGTRLTI